MISIIKLTQNHSDIPRVWELFSEAFHDRARVMMSTILNSMSATLYGIYTEEVARQFAGFFVVLEDEKILFLSFFAICPELRSSGIGSQALHALVEKHRGRQITLAYESILQPSDNVTRTQRERRRAFYLQNGFHESQWYACYDDIEYAFACSQEPVDVAALKQMFSQYMNYEANIYAYERLVI